MALKTSLVAALLAPLLALSSFVPAKAADMLQGGVVYDPGICGDTRLLNTIERRFRYQVEHVPHLPNVEIVEFRDLYEVRYLPERERWPIGRRYCTGTVLLSDGDARQIWYLVEEGMGFASIGDNVEFCVLGFDRWLVYNGACRVLR